MKSWHQLYSVIYLKLILLLFSVCFSNYPTSILIHSSAVDCWGHEKSPAASVSPKSSWFTWISLPGCADLHLNRSSSARGLFTHLIEGTLVVPRETPNPKLERDVQPKTQERHPIKIQKRHPTKTRERRPMQNSRETPNPKHEAKAVMSPTSCRDGDHPGPSASYLRLVKSTRTPSYVGQDYF